MKSARDRMDIISIFQQVGSYRGTAAICGTTPKTVKRVIARAEAGGTGSARVRRVRNYESVAGLVAAKIISSSGRISAKRLLPAALRRLWWLPCRWTSGRGPTGLRRLSGSGRSPSGPLAPGCMAVPVCSARWSLLVWRPLRWGCWRSSLLSCRVSPLTAGRRRAWPSVPSPAPRRSGHSWWSWR